MDALELLSFGELVQAFRKRKGLAQRELAARLGVHYNTISKWERGVCLPDSRGIVLELGRCLSLGSAEARRLLEASLCGLSPYWCVPLPRNPFFCGRTVLLDDLHAWLSGQQASGLRSCALAGLAGVGKTQVAVEYAYRHADAYAAVLWIDAGSLEGVSSSLRAIALVLHLLEHEEADEQQVRRAVVQWLNGHGGWLLIVDQVCDVELIRGVLPAARCGSILFTTRMRTLALAERVMTLESLMVEEGVALLVRRAGLLAAAERLREEQLAPSEEAAAREIVAELGGLPLALDQAGAYIAATQSSLSAYLRLLRSAPCTLLREGDPHSGYPRSLVETFERAFEDLERVSGAALAVLTVCAYLAPEAIPEAFFCAGSAYLGAPFEDLAANPLRFQAALRELLAGSLLQRDPAASTISVHRLVQLTLRGWLTAEACSDWRLRVLRAMAHVFPAERFTRSYWRLGSSLLPHALACLDRQDQRPAALVERIGLLSRVATYLAQRAHFARAERLFHEALCSAECVLGPQHLLVAEALLGSGNLSYDLGNLVAARLCYLRALRIREEALGRDHWLLAAPLNNLAVLCLEEGRYLRAKSLFERALQLSERALEAEHSLLLTIIMNLALLSRELGHYAEAEQLCLHVLRCRERLLGHTHPVLASPLANLATIYVEQGEYQQAELLYRRALSLQEQSLDPAHPQMAYPLQGLAVLSREQGELEQAAALYRDVLRIWEQVSPAGHPHMMYVLCGLAECRRAQGAAQEARQLYERAAEIWSCLWSRGWSGGGDRPSYDDWLADLGEEDEPVILPDLACRRFHLGAPHPEMYF